MEKLSVILMLCVVAITMPVFAHGIDESPAAVENWFEMLPHATEKLTKLRFYLHDTVSGKNPTAVFVAKANITLNPQTIFSVVAVIDDPFTVGPEPTSKILGQAKGIYAGASQEDFGLMLSMNLVFTDGMCNGSTLSILGHDPVFHKYRELPILGGSGVFRLARGIATVQTYSFNTTSLDAILEYDVIVLHYN